MALRNYQGVRPGVTKRYRGGRKSSKMTHFSVGNLGRYLYVIIIYEGPPVKMFNIDHKK